MELRKSGDFILKFMVTCLVIFGIIMVFSSSYYSALNAEGDAYYYLKRVILWALIGGVLMTITSNIPYRLYAHWAPMIMLVAVGLLILVLTPLGHNLNGANRWIGVGPITIMPGELCKPAAAIFTAWFLGRDLERVRDLKLGVLPLLALVVLCCGLIMLQPNLSTAVTVASVVVVIMIAAGMDLKYLVFMAAAGVVAVVGLILIEPYRLARLTSFLDPFADPLNTGFQAVQSLLALGSGGLFGVGLGKSIQKTLYLPEPQNDFIFAIIGEELGFIGCILLLLAFLVLIWRGIHISINARDNFGMLLATGITGMIAIQVVLNIAVVTSSVPATGVALPFISWGGNSLAIFMACAGILNNISKSAPQY